MRVFVTGATGFLGSYLVPELIQAGHHVLGLSRSQTGAEALIRAGAEVFHGDVNDLDRVREGARQADGVIHAAFNHDMAHLKQNSEADRKVILAIGEAIADSGRPFLVSSGTGLARRENGKTAMETSGPISSAEFPRAASEEAADALIAQGKHVLIMRLPQVHDTRRQGRLTWHIEKAREKGWVAYVGEGRNRVSAVHVSDAVRLYRLALEKGKGGGRCHAVGEEGVPMRDIAEAIGSRLQMPVRSLEPGKETEYFGWMAQLAVADLAASSALTRQQLSWTPTGAGLLNDLRNMDDAA